MQNDHRISKSHKMTTYRFSLLLLLCLLGWSCDSNSDQQEVKNEKIQDMEEHFVFVGTYTRKEGHVDGKAKGIYVLKWEEETEQLIRLDTLEGLPNPSYVVVHPSGKFLYAANELADGTEQVLGQVSAYAINPKERSYRSLGNASAEGDAPCHLMILPDGEYAVVANYVGGNVAVLPLTETGGLGEAVAVAQHEGTGPDKGRQAGPHAHMVYPFPGDPQAFMAVDLGIDQVIHYQWHADEQRLQEVARTATMPGAGPRHLVFHPQGPWMYVLNELNHTVEVFVYEDIEQAFERQQVISTLPTESQGISYPAAIKIHPTGKFLYASNRGKTEEENSIAVFSVETGTGKLSLQQVAHTQGDFPRDFELSPSGKYLLAANQNSSNIQIFAIDSETGRLRETGTSFALPTPVCLKFLSL